MNALSQDSHCIFFEVCHEDMFKRLRVRALRLKRGEDSPTITTWRKKLLQKI